MGGVDFRKRILSVLRTTKREKKKRKKESDLPSKPSPLKREAKGEEEEERRRRVVRARREQEQREQQQPSHFVQYASPKTLQPSAFPRLKSSSFKEDKDEEEEEEEKNEYVQKPVLSESQLRNIYSSNENTNDGSYCKGHLKEEDALNDILTTPIVGRKVFVAEE